MASIAPTKIPMPNGADKFGINVLEWNLATGDDGEPVSLTSSSDRSVEVSGTLGGATVRLEGRTHSSHPWAPLHDPQGNDLAVSSYPAGYSAVIETISELTYETRAVVVGGDGSTNVQVAILTRRP